MATKKKSEQKSGRRKPLLPAVIAPIEARSEGQMKRLQEDNTATKDYWLLLNRNYVCLAQQRSGEERIWWTQIPRKDWDKIVKWYMKKQKARGNYGR